MIQDESEEIKEEIDILNDEEYFNFRNHRIRMMNNFNKNIEFE